MRPVPQIAVMMAALTLSLSGCMQTANTAPAASASEEDACGKSRYMDLIGEPERNHSFEPLTPDANISLVRIIYPNSAVTQDYRPERLNVDVNVDGDIARLWCG